MLTSWAPLVARRQASVATRRMRRTSCWAILRPQMRSAWRVLAIEMRDSRPWLSSPWPSWTDFEKLSTTWN